MAGGLSGLFKRERAEIRDARGLYRAVMAQSRRPEFYGEGQIPDTYDGRIDFLTLHMAIFMEALRSHGDNGQKLSQALYDVMIDDFDVALREEGLSDTGVVRRIKPMANLFFERVKAYTDSFSGGPSDIQDVLRAGHKQDLSDAFTTRLSAYVDTLRANLASKSLGVIAKSDFLFPEFT